MGKKPELLSPAGDLEKLKAAVRFGADAVYVGAGEYSLRAGQTNFSLEDLTQGVEFAHQNKVRVYLAMNIFAFDDDFAGMKEYLQKAVKLGIDAVIVSDPGVLSLVRSVSKKLKIHLSTQANTLNSQSVKFWQKQGVSRVVLGRELSLTQIKLIRKTAPKMELELFIHGAMCMSYSGRCLLSKHLTDRSANRGECSHPCRWEYQIKETERPNEELTIAEDRRGTYIMNSRDLCLIDKITELVSAGINSFKIEGRMKSVYYAALVTKIYCQAIDACLAKKPFEPRWKEELEKVSHRHYTTGFYFNDPETENVYAGATIRNYTFVGTVVAHEPKKQQIEVLGRNYFAVSDVLEVLDPDVKEIKAFKIERITSLEGQEQKEAHNQHHVLVKIDSEDKISPDSLLRRRI